MTKPSNSQAVKNKGNKASTEEITFGVPHLMFVESAKALRASRKRRPANFEHIAPTAKGMYRFFSNKRMLNLAPLIINALPSVEGRFLNILSINEQLCHAIELDADGVLCGEHVLEKADVSEKLAFALHRATTIFCEVGFFDESALPPLVKEKVRAPIVDIDLSAITLPTLPLIKKIPYPTIAFGLVVLMGLSYVVPDMLKPAPPIVHHARANPLQDYNAQFLSLAPASNALSRAAELLPVVMSPPTAYSVPNITLLGNKLNAGFVGKKGALTRDKTTFFKQPYFKGKGLSVEHGVLSADVDLYKTASVVNVGNLANQLRDFITELGGQVSPSLIARIDNIETETFEFRLSDVPPSTLNNMSAALASLSVFAQTLEIGLLESGNISISATFIIEGNK